jgi:hypothetical protein
MGLATARRGTNAPRGLNRATGSARHARPRLWGGLSTGLGPPGATVGLGADATVERRAGRTITAKGGDRARHLCVVGFVRAGHSAGLAVEPGRSALGPGDGMIAASSAPLHGWAGVRTSAALVCPVSRERYAGASGRPRPPEVFERLRHGLPFAA